MFLIRELHLRFFTDRSPTDAGIYATQVCAFFVVCGSCCCADDLDDERSQCGTTDCLPKDGEIRARYRARYSGASASGTQAQASPPSASSQEYPRQLTHIKPSSGEVCARSCASVGPCYRSISAPARETTCLQRDAQPIGVNSTGGCNTLELCEKRECCHEAKKANPLYGDPEGPDVGAMARR